MRLAVFIFSFYLVFGQIYYAHSGLPVLGGAVAVARGVGTLIKGGKVLKGSMWGAGAVYAYCTSTPANKKRCKELGGEAVDLILGDDDSGLMCWMSNDIKATLSSTPQQSCSKLNNIYDHLAPLELERVGSIIDDTTGKVVPRYVCASKPYKSFRAPVSYECFGKSDDENKEQELWDKLKDKLSDDEITNIVNNYGDDIDIDKYCASGATCYFIDTEFEKEINNNDYDIDKVNDKNCNMRDGKIVSCPNAKKKKDRDDDNDGQTNNDDKKDNDGQTNNDDDKDGIKIPNIPNFALPKFCTWAKHVCDFTEWVKEPPKDQKPDDYKPEIKDLSELGNQDINKSYYNASGACPAPVAVNLTYGTVYMSYKNYCDFAVKISPLVIALAYILGAYIVARGR